MSVSKEEEEEEKNSEQLEKKEITIDVLLSSQGKVNVQKKDSICACLDIPRRKSKILIEIKHEEAGRFY